MTNSGNQITSERRIPGRDRLVAAGVASAIACQTLLLLLVGRTNRYMLNPDAVSYILLGYHYVKGEFRLAVSGYWGPLLSWLMVPLLSLGQDPLVAARIVMGLSALLFLLGCLTLFRSLQIQGAGLVVGAWLVAIASVPWSVANITPDLLMSGLLCFAIRRLMSSRWVESRAIQFIAGLLFGAAYLAKAVALPIAVALILAIGSFWVLKEPARLRIVLRSALITGIGLLLVAGPWIVVLSAKYGTFVFSTSGKVAHAIVGPHDIERSPGNKAFHTPEAGRLIATEDPTSLPYAYWSPFESREYFKHQVGVIYHNGRKMSDFLAGFDFFHFGLVAVLWGLLVRPPWRDNLTRDPWRWAVVIIACMSVFYLPVYAGDERYYYGAYPFLVASSLGTVVSLTSTIRGRINVPRLVGFSLVTLSFVQTPVLNVANALTSVDDKYVRLSSDLATKVHALGRDGSFVSVGTCLGDVPPMFVALFLNQVYHGCEISPTLMNVKGSGAKLILVVRSLPLIDELERDPQFEDLDSILFKTSEVAAQFPVKVFQMQTTP
jgi:hypothetical protein